MTDTHAHLFLDDFSTDLPEVIARAKSAGITKILMPNIDSSTLEALHKTEKEYDGYCLAMSGLHPTSVESDYVRQLNLIESSFRVRTYCAIGEIGIDLYWDKTRLKEQIIAFEAQLNWAKEWDLPVVIHVRESFPHVLESIYKVGPDRLRGVFHSFGGSIEDAEEIMKLNTFKMGINGVVTFKNSSLSNTLLSVPLSYIVLETDAPYLTPVPYRGKRNESVYMIYTAQKLAEIYQLPVNKIAEITTQNANLLFSLPQICPC